MKFIKWILAFFIIFISTSAVMSQVLKTGISMVPRAFFGSWRVVSNLIETDSSGLFKDKGVDLWNISRENDVITLSNPFSGATAQIKINSVNENKIVFTKSGSYDNKLLTDTVSININGDNFTGFDVLKLDTISDVSGKIIKSETAKYAIKGEKIAGQSVLGN